MIYVIIFIKITYDTKSLNAVPGVCLRYLPFEPGLRLKKPLRGRNEPYPFRRYVVRYQNESLHTIDARFDSLRLNSKRSRTCSVGHVLRIIRIRFVSFGHYIGFRSTCVLYARARNRNRPDRAGPI